MRFPLVAFGISLTLMAGAVACSSSDPSGRGLRGDSSDSGGTASSGGSVASSGGSGGSATGGSNASGGSATGGSASGGSGGSVATGGSGTGGAATGGSTGTEDCTPNPAGTFVDQGEVVFDERHCLHWWKATMSDGGYYAGETLCTDSTLGGYDDWRLPTAGEAATIFDCDQPPVHPAFEVTGDGFWTTTESGTVAGDDTKVCGAGQASGQFYDFGKVGGQNTRCVRGPITVPEFQNCKDTPICQ